MQPKGVITNLSERKNGSKIGLRVNAYPKGFTLIEILVVLLIVGIAMGFTMMALGDFGEKRRITMTAERFIQYVKLTQQQAILETSTLGIAFNNHGYQVLHLSQNKGWLPMLDQHVFHLQRFPKGLIVQFRNTIIKYGTPQIMINASGGMTAFTLDFGTHKQAVIATISGTSNGAITIQTIKTP